MRTNSTKFIYLLLFSTILFWGCSDDDDETTDTIIGTWVYEYYGDEDGNFVGNSGEEELFLYSWERIFNADSTAVYRFSMKYSDGRILFSDEDLGKFTIQGNEILYESGKIEIFKIEKNTLWLTRISETWGIQNTIKYTRKKHF